jgi:uncharacterized protein
MNSLKSDPSRPKTRSRFRSPNIQQVSVGGFWVDRVAATAEKTVPILQLRCDEAGMFDQVDPARPVPEQRIPFSTAFGGGKVRPVGGNVTAQMYWDSDVAKMVEAAAFGLALRRDDAVEAMIDRIVDMYEALQQEDGYLNSWYIRMQPGKRWTNLRDCHELYCAGHLIEAAVAYYQATGKRKFMDVMGRYVDHIAGMFGTEPGKRRGYCGHEEIELALVKLARATGERRYLDLARYFIDERGRQPHYFLAEAEERAEEPGRFAHGTFEYNQSHVPVREQTKVVGHAVRAMYLYSAVADLVTEYGDEALRTMLDSVWNDLVTKRLYVTGGLGPSADNEGFTTDFDLPNESAYAETCAAVGLVFWASRMLGFGADGRYADVMEQALYNGALSGVSLDGTRFFYENPLESRGNHHRWSWHRCPCCPPNLARLIASVGTYAYGVGESEIAVHLYGESEARLDLGGKVVRLSQRTQYPWDGSILITLGLDEPTAFDLLLRIPAWCRNATLKVNGDAVDLAAVLHRGYARLERSWNSGDRVEITLDLTVQRLYAHPNVRQDRDRVALRRGPLVYCLEGTDHPVPLNRISLSRDAAFEARFEPDLLGGVVTLRAPAAAESDADWPHILYRSEPPRTDPVRIKAVPYYAWDNRDPGEMLVWLREAGAA